MEPQIAPVVAQFSTISTRAPRQLIREQHVTKAALGINRCLLRVVRPDVDWPGKSRRKKERNGNRASQCLNYVIVFLVLFGV
jgi:hypothetical protein